MKRISTPFPHCFFSCLYCGHKWGSRKLTFASASCKHIRLQIRAEPLLPQSASLPPFSLPSGPQDIVTPRGGTFLKPAPREALGLRNGGPTESGPLQAAAAAGSTCLPGLSPSHYHAARTDCQNPSLSFLLWSLFNLALPNRFSGVAFQFS